MRIVDDTVCEKSNYGFVYETTNLVNNKKYIGKCIFSRQNDWRKYLGSGTYLKRAIKKYGKENFKRSIIALAKNEIELNHLEEAIIEKLNAVESKEYYNLKKTSIGGDIFTHNPNKEKIRASRVSQMSGMGNNQYGKPKTEKMIMSVKEANSKPIMVDDVVYKSTREFEATSGIGNTTIHFRLNSPFYSNYLYVDENNTPISKEVKEKVYVYRNTTPKKVSIDGVVYNSISKASIATSLARHHIYKRLEDEEYPNIKWV